MATLHVENTVHDYDEWKAVFDKFEKFRADNGMRSYRLSRYVDEPTKVTVDMEFDSEQDASAFREKLIQIRTTPQSKSVLVTSSGPHLLQTVVQKTLQPAVEV
jgi:hypothetical protein